MGFSPDFVLGTDVQNYEAIEQLWRACRDIAVAIAYSDHVNSRTWPPGTWVYVNGKIRTRLAPTGQLPVGTVGSAYNVIQKARASNLGGFWKMEIRGNGNGTGRVRCTLGDGRLVLVVESTNRVDDGNWHSFGCNLSLGAFTVVVDGVATSIDATSLGGVHPVEQFSQSVMIGKKPGSTDPSDSFSGWLDDVSIAAG